MPTTLTREKLPITDAQAADALKIANDVCRSFGVGADISLEPYDDPDLTPSRVALLTVQLGDDVPRQTFLDMIPALGRVLRAHGLHWPEVAFEPYVT